jgi:uncharacterized protein
VAVVAYYGHRPKEFSMVRSLDLVGGTEMVPVDRCLQLLGTESIGRVAVIVGDDVDVFPVNYIVDGDRIAFATNVGRKMSGMLAGRLAFEVDSIDLPAHAGWSVIVHGVVDSVEPYTDEKHTGAENHPKPQPWAGQKKLLVRIRPETISGRRVSDADWSPRV